MSTIENQIALFDKEVAAFVECVRSLQEDQFLRKLNHWSPRDIVAYLIGWNRATCGKPTAVRNCELPHGILVKGTALLYPLDSCNPAANVGC
jgi:hypothetical protein